MKFRQMLVQLMTNILNSFFTPVCEDLKLVTVPFMILIEWQYNATS